MHRKNTCQMPKLGLDIRNIMLGASGFLFALPRKHPLHRRADTFVGAMDAAYPAARPSHAFLKLGDDPAHMFVSRFLLLDRHGPANPLVARERRKAFPGCTCRRRGHKSPPQVGWQGMYGAARQFFIDHT